MQLFRWSPEHIAAIGRAPDQRAPLFSRGDAPPVVAGVVIWDHWPALTVDGRLASIDGGLLVTGLSAPFSYDPEQRHAHARLRLLHRTGECWRDLGPLLPEGFSPGSREWAGSTLIDPESRRLTLYFTAAGQRGEARISYEQRLYACTVSLGPDLQPEAWGKPVELTRPDGLIYQTDLTGGGVVGTIKAFRDPWFFRDPNGSGDFILFAASRADATSEFNGLVGAARLQEDRWRLTEPWVDATGVNNELERPHVVVHAGRLYLFWSTQRKVFAPSLRHARTGLYGAVADRLGALWRPLNGHGLVFANPDAAPAQAYSWQVLPDLTVWSFADLVALGREPASVAEASRHFVGAPAPPLKLVLAGDEARLDL